VRLSSNAKYVSLVKPVFKTLRSRFVVRVLLDRHVFVTAFLARSNSPTTV
jgi:hypothetical protein